MKMRLLFMLFLTASAMGQTWTQCAQVTMTLTGINDGGCVPLSPYPYNPGTKASIADTWVYQDQCTNSITGNSVYYSGSSSVTGNGECLSRGYVGPNHSLVWDYCRASNQSQVTYAQNANDLNRMYNRAYDNVYEGNTPSSCAYTGIWRQNMQQCGPISCPTQLSGCCVNPTQCSYPGSGQQCNFSSCACQSITPIIIDTTGHGFHLTSADRGVLFDFFNDSAPIQMAWTAGDSGDGFLVLDRNHNRRIDSGFELFGSENKDGCDNGFCVLAKFDKPENGGNGDGIIDWHDAVYSKLQIWIDANHDGISQPWELHSLPSMGVYSIGLHYTLEAFVDQYGNAFRYRAALNPNPLDGSSPDGKYLYDIVLKANPSKVKREGCQPQKQPLPQLSPDPLRESLVR